jgi:hypothetical protein
MKPRILAFLLLSLISAPAQERDLVPSGLKPLIVREPRKSNEVTVVLDPPSFGKPEEVTAPPPQPAPPLIDNLDSLPETPMSPPEDTPLAEAPEVSPETPSVFPKKQGVVISVEKLQSPSGPIDPADVELLAPFLAKPKFKTPEGWKLDTVSTAPPFNREVEIAPGSKIPLAIRPHVLIPDTDAATTFAVDEPGYDSSLGYAQTSTISALLSKSLDQMERDSKAMGDVIDSLQQLLVSLPKPSAPDASIENAPVAKPVKKP